MADSNKCSHLGRDTMANSLTFASLKLTSFLVDSLSNDAACFTNRFKLQSSLRNIKKLKRIFFENVPRECTL